MTTALFNRRGNVEFYFMGSIADLIAKHGSSGAIVWGKVGKIQEIGEDKVNLEL